MIESLRLENVAIVERAEIEFGTGLNVLTGETGAGKSIVLSALALLAGGRASAEAIRDGCEEAAVEALFRTAHLADLEAELAARGLAGDDHELIVQRSVSRAGRGRARISGQLVPVATLAELFGGRIEISSQHESQELLRPESHARLLDAGAGLTERRRAVAAGHAALRALDAELAGLRAAAAERERRQDFLRFQIQEIDDAALDAASVAELRTQRARLAHAGRLLEEGGAALAAIAGEGGEAEAPGAADALGAAARRLEALARLDPSLEELAARVAALSREVREAGLDLERSLAGIEADPARLATADERLHRIERLERKYGGSVEEVLRFRAAAAEELAASTGVDTRALELDAQRRACAESLADEARALSAGRQEARGRLARAVQARLRGLGMRDARFDVALEAVAPPEGAPCAPAGCEVAEFLFSANAGESLRPLRRVASGGELSRALLALKGALREAAAGMVLVFDEVDAALGGRAADRVGQALAELAERHQVLCITHLPQIAAFAHVHFRIEKHTRGGRTGARIERVEGAERVEELARMAGGERVGEATRRHARDLLAARSPAPR